jgi:DNA-binding Lrp family transcriptional regulator
MKELKSHRGLPRPGAGAGHGSVAGEGPAVGPADGRLEDVRIVEDPKMADMLTDPATLRQLEPFLARAASVAQAARETGQKPNTVLSRVRRMLAAGVLVQAGVRPRRGRPVRLYRSTADAFFIPFDATSAESLESALAEREAFWERQLRESVVRARRERVGVWGTRIYRDVRGRLQIQTAVTPERNFTTLDPEGPAVLSAWRDRVYLDFEDAKELQREMFDLLLRYQRKEGSQRYIVRLGMAPLAD